MPPLSRFNFKKIKSRFWLYIKNHQILSFFLVCAIIFAGRSAYVYFTKKSRAISYVGSVVEKGALITSVTGSGQVSSLNQLEIKPRVSGDIVNVFVKSGDEVSIGKTIAVINTKDAEKNLRDAIIGLETAKLELDEILKPADELTLLQAETALADAMQSKNKAEANVQKSYDDGFNTVANAFLDLPNIMTGLEETFFNNTLDKNQSNISWYLNQTEPSSEDRNAAAGFEKDFSANYTAAKAAFEGSFKKYSIASRNSDQAVIETLIDDSYQTARIISDTVKSANNFLNFIDNVMKTRNIIAPALISTHKSNLNSYTSKSNSSLSNLLSAKRTIQESKESVISAENNITQKTISLNKIKASADELSVRAKRIAVQQKTDALQTAKDILGDHYVKVPFNSVVAKVSVKKGDSVSSGSALFTLISKQKIAEISLNEVDIAKVKVGNKATLSIDAIPDLTIAGSVIEVDSIGAVSQGVVTYAVKIAFDTDDNLVKPGMSVSASIITNSKADTLLIPVSAVKKNSAGSHYVEVPNQTELSRSNGTIFTIIPETIPVEIGDSNDEFIEIISGLKEGDIVISRTIQPANSKNNIQSNQQQSAVRLPGLNGPGGGTFIRTNLGSFR